MSDDDRYYILDPSATDPARIRREREKARKLRKSNWWQRQVNRGVCHYCEKKFPPGELTMDHVVPLARGGSSMQGNLVPACKACNRDKKLDTPADRAFEQLDARSPDAQSDDARSDDDTSRDGGDS